MRRHQIEDLLRDAYSNNGGATDFDIVVPLAEVAASLTILRHLKTSGFITSFSRRDGQSSSGRDDCIRIYGFNG